MKMKLRKFMQQAASYVEIVLSAFLLIVIMFLAGKFIVESVLGIGCDNATLEYFLENVMTFAIGVEFVKMLCTHTPGTVIEVLLFAISRQMIVGHVSGFEVLAGVAAGPFQFAMINPVITRKSGAFETEEGCLSLDGVRSCTRYEEIEVDHCNGIVI